MKRIRQNAIWNIAEVLAGSLMLFVLYKAILHYLGVGAMGVWSLVVSATAVGRVADIGMSSGLGRYVALSAARGDPSERALVYVETALITNGALYLVLGTAIYWPAWHALAWATSGTALEQARDLLPFAIVAFATQNLSTVTNAALTGQHRSGLKSQLSLITLSVQCVMALALVRGFGLAGLAVAQITQYILLAIAGWFLVAKGLNAKPSLRLPSRVDRDSLRDLTGFGLKMQGLTLAGFLFEPATKFVLSGTLGVSALGIYELVSRGVLQVRAVILAPSQNLTPSFTAALHRDASELRPLYDRATALLTTLGGLAMAALALGSPVISLIWLERVDMTFVTLSFIVAGGWWCNIVAVPGYYLGIASGVLRWNIIGAGITAVMSPMLAAALAGRLGIPGAVTGLMTGVAAGALLTATMNARRSQLDILPRVSLAGEIIGGALRRRGIAHLLGSGPSDPKDTI